jgi:transglutaminase-like putative cysteine protease
MRIRISHQTAYEFEPPARAITQILRLEPREASTQQVRNWRIETGGDAFLRRSQDSFGNVVHTLHAEGPLADFSVVASGEVHTEDTNGVVGGTFEPLPLALFLRDTPRTRATPEMDEFAAELMATHVKAGAPLDALHALMAGLAEHMHYKKDSTDNATAGAEAFEVGEGVCQDFSHIFAACARSQGIPARYVSGYLHEDQQPASSTQEQSQNGKAQAQSQGQNTEQAATDGAEADAATHAWNEAFVTGLGWVAFDVTHNICPTEHYVRVAVGLDALDAAPVRGVRQGVGEEAMRVSLSISGDRFGG